jgi:hypothetical protein
MMGGGCCCFVGWWLLFDMTSRTRKVLQGEAAFSFLFLIAQWACPCHRAISRYRVEWEDGSLLSCP